MDLKAAIKMAKKKNRRIKVKSLNFFEQDAKSLVYWMFVNSKSKKESLEQFNKFVNATDWELERNETDLYNEDPKSVFYNKEWDILGVGLFFTDDGKNLFIDIGYTFKFDVTKTWPDSGWEYIGEF